MCEILKYNMWSFVLFRLTFYILHTKFRITKPVSLEFSQEVPILHLYSQMSRYTKRRQNLRSGPWRGGMTVQCAHKNPGKLEDFLTFHFLTIIGEKVPNQKTS